MSEIKLLSIKRNEEASYFYESNVPTTLDSNRNEVVEDRPPQISRKARKEEEKRSRKEKKQKIKDSKKLEKEKRKSLKISGKEVVGTADTDQNRADIKTNGGVTGTHLINTGFQAGLDIDEAAKNENELNEPEGHRNENEELREEREGALNQHVVLSKDHEGASNGHEVSFQTHKESDQATPSEEHEISVERQATATVGHAENREQITPAMEETITAEGAQHTEEAPPDILYQPKVNPEFFESTGGQHVEIEISEVTDLEADASGSYEVAAVQHSTQTSAFQNGAVTEGEITAAMVQQVESEVDVDGIFASSLSLEDDVGKEEKRRSVRFQEETEEIGHSEGESNDHEHASLNLGGDFSGTSDEQHQTLEPAVEIVSKEERSGKGQRCEVDLDDIFASAEPTPSVNEEVPSDKETGQKEVDQVNGVKLNDSAKVNGKSKVNDLVEVELNDSNKQQNTAVKKEKRKRSGLVRCCFP